MRAIHIAIAVLLAFSWHSTVNAAEIVLIVNRANGVDSMTRQEAQQIFLGKKANWSNGRKIVAVIQQDPYTHDVFTREIVRRSPQQFATYWKKALFTGTGIPPRSLENDEAVKSFVAANREAIGYISEGALDGTVKGLEIQ